MSLAAVTRHVEQEPEPEPEPEASGAWRRPEPEPEPAPEPEPEPHEKQEEESMPDLWIVCVHLRIIILECDSLSHWRALGDRPQGQSID